MALNNKIFFIFTFLNKLAPMSKTFSDIKNNPESREVSVVMGKKATKYNIWFLLSMAVAVGCAFLTAHFLSNNGILLGILCIAGVAFFALWGICMSILAFTASIYQLRLNKKPIGIINLVFSLMIILIVIVVFILMAVN